MPSSIEWSSVSSKNSTPFRKKHLVFFSNFVVLKIWSFARQILEFWSIPITSRVQIIKDTCICSVQIIPSSKWEMYNDLIDKIFFLISWKNKITSHFVQAFVKFTEGFLFSYVSIFIISYMMWDQKIKKWQDKLCISMKKMKCNRHVENKTKILYNNIVDQLKGM